VKVTFENATIRDVIGKAARIAPSKGAAMDKAAGIHIEVDPNTEQVIVRSTNLEVTYMEVADTLSIEPGSALGSVEWRLPSAVIDGICSKLPIASGKSVTIDDEGGDSAVKIVSGRMRATVRLIDTSYYPTWEPFDESSLEVVNDFAKRINLVSWAVAKTGDPPLIGVHLTGTHVAATDHYKVAIAPLEAGPIYKPVTIPAAVFTTLGKNLGDVRIGMEDQHLLIMPDNATQIRTVVYGNEYPPVLNVFKRNEDTAVTFRRQGLLEIIERAMVMGQRDRTPLLKMIVGLEEIAVMMTDKELGLLGDVVEVPGYAQHDRLTICFTPDNLVASITNAPNDEITLHYMKDNPLKPVRVDGGSGYEVLIMPRKESD
jgi:DNA polymerase III sliding clamp (beta) subunit (PCNA family)